ncbi:MAG TPA: hypothetical protein DIT48_06320 [Actinobacteria bacterium]|nr:hypothetical protein [Actinomycetota bacterium]HCP62105.1 hypothetical protein [Actinomycetota bacterium]
MGELRFRREYLCEFFDRDDAVFSSATVARMFDETIEPQFQGGAVGDRVSEHRQRRRQRHRSRYEPSMPVRPLTVAPAGVAS